MAIVEIQSCVRECDGEPSWFLLTQNSPMKVAQG